jgi:hypothetical protein
LLDAAIAHGAKKEALHLPATPGPDDEQRRPFRFAEKDVCGIASHDPCTHVRALVGRNGAVDDLVQLDARVVDERVETVGADRYIERGGMLRERPRRDHLEGEAHQRRLIGGPAQSPERRLGAIDPDDDLRRLLTIVSRTQGLITTFRASVSDALSNTS